MNVLSLFDGKSSGYTAMELAGIEVGKYYSAEVDKYAIQVSDSIHPNQIRLGDVTKWREWDINWSSIDLMLGGFPCQAWSMAGKQLGYKDERGMLFWTMLDIFKHVRIHNPKAQFLIENVKMKKEFEEYITYHTEQALGEVHKTLINSALVSAQNRNRYYWTSFPVSQPEDRGIVLADVLESDGTGWIKNKGDWSSRNDKSMCVDANYFKGVDNHGQKTMIKCGPMIDSSKLRPCEMKQTEVAKSASCHHVANATDINGNESIKRVYAATGKAPTLTTMGGGHREPKLSVNEENTKYRKLTPRECFRLQTVPEHYIDKILASGVSNTQLYKVAGNGWTDEVIAHIFRCMVNKVEVKEKAEFQLSLAI